MPSKRMTANPLKPTRYRPGKGPEEAPSSSTEEDDSQAEEEDLRRSQFPQSAPAPKATSFPAAKIASTLKSVDLNARHAQASVEEYERLRIEAAARAKEEEEGFETESSEEEEGSGTEESEI